MHDILHLFFAIGMAVDYAHQRGMIHRDIKTWQYFFRDTRVEDLFTSLHSIGSQSWQIGIVKLLGATSNTVKWRMVGTPLNNSQSRSKGA